jgi:hypothetical protein
MVLLTTEVVGILMRWAHIASMAVLLGGVAYARLVAFPVVARAGEEGGPEMSERLAARYRPLMYAAIGGLVLSGLYNFLTHAGHTPYYHAWFGIKILFVLHVFAASVLAMTSSPATAANEARRVGRMTGIVMSGILIVLISAYLRRIY